MQPKKGKEVPADSQNEVKMCPLYDGKVSTRIIWVIILFIVSWSILLYYHPPEELVDKLGVNNVYIFVFMLAMIGGVSTFTSTTFYTALITIALGGVNTILIAVFASVGLTSGDLLFYYMGTKSKNCIKSRYADYVLALTKRIENIDDRMIMLLIFLYSLTPLPSDIIAIALAIAEFSFKKMIVPLLVGNFILIIILVELSKLGYSLV
ncbi:VTT domain-containing protein [Methanolobus psychrotolerans]|uniref:VTT domain-containing protein n=1 Tax=Methanolobus psychrotolerans TaxID=1874706 RepID=UPI001F5DF791|nr:VTT domain-containing protein [Methanolobus psychrotolerans]